MLRPIRTGRRSPVYFPLIALVPVLLLLLLAVSPAGSVEEPPLQAPASFTNKDLDQYKPTATDNQPLYQPGSGPKDTGQDDLRHKTDKQASHREREYWCKKGRQARKKVKTARAEVEAFKELLTEFRNTEVSAAGKKRTVTRKNIQKTEKNLAAAGKRLKDKEALLAELEDDARRQNIPAGWTRCQFE
ncbi:MAG: hypothetical protein ACYC69_15825 [Thermodesulfovibrionales bacterium]